jgi:hypothetical protein
MNHQHRLSYYRCANGPTFKGCYYGRYNCDACGDQLTCTVYHCDVCGDYDECPSCYAGPPAAAFVQSYHFSSYSEYLNWETFSADCQLLSVDPCTLDQNLHIRDDYSFAYQRFNDDEQCILVEGSWKPVTLEIIKLTVTNVTSSGQTSIKVGNQFDLNIVGGFNDPKTISGGFLMSTLHFEERQ